MWEGRSRDARRSRKARASGLPGCWGAVCPRPHVVLQTPGGLGIHSDPQGHSRALTAHGTYPVTHGGFGSAGLLGALRATAAKRGCPTTDQTLGGTVGEPPCPGGSRFLQRSRCVVEEPHRHRPSPPRRSSSSVTTSFQQLHARKGARRPGRLWGPWLICRPAALLGIPRGQQVRAMEGRSEVRAGKRPPQRNWSCKRPRHLVGTWPLQRRRECPPLKGHDPRGGWQEQEGTALSPQLPKSAPQPR